MNNARKRCGALKNFLRAKKFFLLACGLALTGFNLQAEPLSATTVRTATPKRFATVWRIQGDVTATAQGALEVRHLKVDDSVLVGERLQAMGAAEAVLKTDDAGLIALRPGASFSAESFAAEGKPTDHVTFRILAGGLRFISGWIGKSYSARYRINTPTATIGIRGTDHEPFVITSDLAREMRQQAGTYDKVNRGGTALISNGNAVDINPGNVGFVRVQGPGKERALLTLLLPVLLDEVPDFYVPGLFDMELDALSASQEQKALLQLAMRRKSMPLDVEAMSPTDTYPTQTAAGDISLESTATNQPYVPNSKDTSSCPASRIGARWLASLDSAIAKHQIANIVGVFDADIKIVATIIGSDGRPIDVESSRDEFVRSAVRAINGLTDFKQTRPITNSEATDVKRCDRIRVKSVAIESGVQSGVAYRFESREEYLLQRRGTVWIAIEASTRQR